LLGVIDLNDMTVEAPETVAARIRRALPYVKAEDGVVAPDCGMKYLPREVAYGKMKAMVAGARIMREECAGHGASWEPRPGDPQSSGVIQAAVTSLRQRARSGTRWRVNSSGVAPTPSPPSVASFSCRSGALAAFTSSALSRLSIAGGRPAGASQPCHVLFS